MSSINIKNITPKHFFFASIILVFLFYTFSSRSIGWSTDEMDVNLYGKEVLKYYTSFGKDTSCFNVVSFDRKLTVLKHYGASFDITAALINKVIKPKNEYIVRHYLNAFLATILVLFTGLLAAYIGGWKAGIIAIWLIFLSPRFYGQAIYNTKDLPFATAFAVGIYFFTRLANELGEFNYKVVIGGVLAVALAISMRAGGLLLLAYLFLFVFVGVLFNNDTRKSLLKLNFKKLAPIIISTLIIAIGGYILGVLLWPYALKDPLHHPFESLKVVSDFPQRIPVLFEGKLIDSFDIPKNYIPKLLFITTPIIILFSFISFPVLFFKKVKPLFIVVLLFAVVFPVYWVIHTEAALYSGWRHLLFIYSSFILLGAVSIKYLFDYLPEKISRFGLPVVLVIGLLFPSAWMIKNHPFQITYYNAFVGGTNGAYLNYDMDYFQFATKQGWEWLKENEDIKSGKKIKLYSNNPHVLEYLVRDYSNIEVLNGGFSGIAYRDWDYAILSSIFVDPKLVKLYYPPRGTIHKVKAEDVPLAAVIKRENDYDVRGISLITSNQDLDKATDYLEKSYNYNNKNYTVWYYLGYAYFQKQKFKEALSLLSAYDKLFPDKPVAKKLIAYCYVNLQDYSTAMQYLQQLLANNKNDLYLNYYTGVTLLGLNKTAEAINFLENAVQLNPQFGNAYVPLYQAYIKTNNTDKAMALQKQLSRL